MASGAYYAKSFTVGAAVTLLLLTGCRAHAPSAQVLAIVNDQEVTQRDFAADLAAASLPKDTDARALQAAVVDDLINRKLLVQQARQQGLQSSPNYLASRDRLQEMALVQQLILSWANEVPTPSLAQAEAFIDRNPQMFSRREVYLLDQVHTSGAGIDPKALEPIHSMDAIAAYLRQQGHPFRRGSAMLDTLTAPATTAHDLAQLAPGQPFETHRGGALVISAVTQSQAVPAPDDQRMDEAIQALKRERVQGYVREKLSGLRSSAKISYATNAVALVGSSASDASSQTLAVAQAR